MSGDAPAVNQRDQHMVPDQHVVQGLGEDCPSAHVAGARQFPQQPVIGRAAIARNVLSLPARVRPGFVSTPPLAQIGFGGRRLRT